jgi:hypothetical protein
MRTMSNGSNRSNGSTSSPICCKQNVAVPHMRIMSTGSAMRPMRTMRLLAYDIPMIFCIYIPYYVLHMSSGYGTAMSYKTAIHNGMYIRYSIYDSSITGRVFPVYVA